MCGVLILAAASVNSWCATSMTVAFLWLLARSLPRRNDLISDTPRRWGLVWIAVGLALLAVARNALATPATQGRHIFPSLGALSLLMASGWTVLLPNRIARFLPGVAIALLVALNLNLLFAGVNVYYQPFLN